MGVRRKAREFAMQTIYSQEITEKYWEDAVKEFVFYQNLVGYLKEFYKELCDTYFKNQDLVNRKITLYIKNWDYDRVAQVDKAILRVAISEMLFFDDIPANVSIDEAIEIAKKYSTDKSGSFINGVLDAIKMEEKIK